jgi:hypothetical protein
VEKSENLGLNPDKTVADLVNLSKKPIKDNDDVLMFQALLYKWSEGLRAQRTSGDDMKKV